MDARLAAALFDLCLVMTYLLHSSGVYRRD